MPSENKAESLNYEYESVRTAFDAALGYGADAMPVTSETSRGWMADAFEGYVIAEFCNVFYKVPYTKVETENSETITFSPRSEWTEVERKTEWEEIVKSLKIGSRNNKDDMTTIQGMHDASVRLGASCGSKSLTDEETITFYGKEVKAVKLENGDVKLGGYLVTYGDANDTDVSDMKDFFTKNTDFGKADTATGWFNHRMPVYYNGKSVQYSEPLPDVKLKKDDIGVFAEVVIGARNDYEKAIAELGLAGKLGWSSGTANHLVDRKAMKNGAHEITRWPLGLDASLTPTPAEPKNSAIPLKSLINLAVPEIKKDNKMEMTKEELKELVDGAAKTAVEAIKAAAPAPDTAGVVVTHDEGDTKFESLAENAKAIKNAMSPNGKVDPRLSRLQKQAIKANGANEGTPSEGGYPIEPTLVAEVLKPMHENGPFTSKVRKMPVGNNSNFGYINGIDETSRVAGSRWGGVVGYRLSEAGTLTKSKPAFRRINWELKKYGVLMYATDELLADSSQFAAVARQSAGEELNFMANDDILNGLGVGGPLGVMKSGALITVQRDTASKVLHADILGMWQRLHPRFRGGAEWYINSDVETQLMQLYFSGTTSVLSPYVSYGMDGVMRIMGKPVNVTEFNPSLNTTGDILLANMGEYLFWEKGGIQEATSIHLAFLTDESAFRWIYRCDGQTAEASAITPYKGSNTQSAFVVLGSASA